MVKTVDKKLYKNYLKKAEEQLDVAKYAFDRAEYTAAVTASIHSVINAIDAIAVFYLGKRHSERHEDSLNIIKGTIDEGEYNEINKQFTGLIELKNEAEYQPYLMEKGQAEDAVKRASRILLKAKQMLQ